MAQRRDICQEIDYRFVDDNHASAPAFHTGYGFRPPVLLSGPTVNGLPGEIKALGKLRWRHFFFEFHHDFTDRGYPVG